MRVTDELARQVPHTTTEKLETGVTVQFTPASPGDHRVEAVFQPYGGVVRKEVVALEDQRQATPSLVLPRSCSTLMRTGLGSWLCNRTVLRGDEAHEGLDALPWAVDGRWVWTWNREVWPRTVSLYEDMGEGALLHRGSLEMSGVTALAAGAGAAVTLQGNTLNVLRWDVEEGLRQVSSLPLEVALDDADFVALLVEEGKVRLLASPYRPGPTTLCEFRLDPGGAMTAEGDCHSLEGSLYGYEPGVVWTRELTPPGGLEKADFAPDRPNLRRYVLEPGGPRLHTWTRVPSQVWLLLPGSLTAPSYFQPEEASMYVSPRLEGNTLVLQLLETDRLSRHVGVAPGFHWHRGLGGDTTGVWFDE